MTETWPSAVAAGWHPLALISEIRDKPVSRSLMGQPLVIFKGTSGPQVLLDRCPHRGIPLATGRVSHGCLICPYHGWSFAEKGRCVAVPGSDSVPPVSAHPFPVILRAGLVWTSLAETSSPFPVLPSEMENPELDSFWWAIKPSSARVLDAIENLIDPAHPHYLHPWIVRSPNKRRAVRVKIQVGPQGAEAVYHENFQTNAWIPRLLEGNRMRSIGRYFPPTMAQVAFENDKGLSLAVSVVFTPEHHDRIRAFAHFATPKGICPRWLKRVILKIVHIPVLHQDQQMLALQVETMKRLGRVDFAHGPLDFMGPVIWRLANNLPQPTESYEVDAWL